MCLAFYFFSFIFNFVTNFSFERRREKIINLVELAEVYVMAFADEAALGLVLVAIMDVDAEPALTMDLDKNHPKEFRKMVPVRAVEDTVDVLSEDDVAVAVVEPGLVLERGLKERLATMFY